VRLFGVLGTSPFGHSRRLVNAQNEGERLPLCACTHNPLYARPPPRSVAKRPTACRNWLENRNGFRIGAPTAGERGLRGLDRPPLAPRHAIKEPSAIFQTVS
jgi:hypothetical protein